MDKCAETDNGGSRGQLNNKHDAEQYHLSLNFWFFSFKRNALAFIEAIEKTNRNEIKEQKKILKSNNKQGNMKNRQIKIMIQNLLFLTQNLVRRGTLFSKSVFIILFIILIASSSFAQKAT